MKSDEKVIEEFVRLFPWLSRRNCIEILNHATGATLDTEPKTVTEIVLNEEREQHIKRIKDFLLKTRREAVEEAFKAIEIDLLGDGDHSEYELGHDNAIDEINRKKEEFLFDRK